MLQILFGLFFIASGLLKLDPIETFELTFVDLGVSSWKLAPFLARTIIGYELVLGVLLVTNLSTKRVLKQSFGLLVFFTIYLLFLWVTKGDEGNCGCLGARFSLTPSESIMKNVLLLGVNILLFKRSLKFQLPYPQVFTLILVLAGLVLPYVLNPINFSQDNLYDVELPYAIDYLNEVPGPVINGDTVNMAKGEKIIAVLSLTCQHCKHAAYKLAIAARKYKLPPIYFIFKGAKSEKIKAGLDKKKDAFFKESNSLFPFVYFHDDRIFKMAKGIFPTILHVKDTNVWHVWHGSSLTYDALENLETAIGENQ